ncbi:Uncharacterized protein SCF082_LOCUS42649 [Durusdinium trenchii]|uniref:Uncharacterized protein n=1 Tax=Durusdinium trenchii TaxID=1381693 RepID=A0ABP0QQ74_9DINO
MNPRDRQKAWILSGLKHLGAPIVLATVVALLFQVEGLDWANPVQHVETFSGKMSVTKAEMMEGRRAIPLDVELDPSRMNFLDNIGFSNALYWVCNSEPGSGFMSAPVCSTFVAVSRGSTLRSRTRPLGRTDSQAVRDGNLLAARAVLLCLLCSCKAMFWVLEQPGSSIMHLHPLFQRLMRLVTVHQLRVPMSRFGGPTKKPTLLFSSHQCIEGIQQFMVPERLQERQMTIRYRNGAGKWAFCGGPDLKKSQAYPPQFGIALAKTRTMYLKRNYSTAMKFLRRARHTTGDFDRRPRVNRQWTKMADLQPVIDFLSQSHK